MRKEKDLLREFVRESIKDSYANMHNAYDTRHLLRMMMDSPGIITALHKINSPVELAQFLDAIIDTCPSIRRSDVLDSLRKVTNYEIFKN